MASPHDTRYELYYWPGIPGRGEFVRLVFEDAGVPYIDVGRLPPERGGGAEAVAKLLEGEQGAPLPFAPPIVKIGNQLIAQTGHICHLLATRFGLVPNEEASRTTALQLQLTVADFVAEVHDTHHPIASELYYEDQKPEARRRAEAFRQYRMPKFLHYFERVLENNEERGGRGLIGDGVSYVDLSMFQVLEGLRYAFPNAFERIAEDIPRLCALRDGVARRSWIAAYLASERRQPFNENGIFRQYPELDD